MNDFTKEELESILYYALVYTEFGTCWTYKLHEPLMNKIQSMIDDYTEIKIPLVTDYE
jgi:flagellar motor component MotA